MVKLDPDSRTFISHHSPHRGEQEETSLMEDPLDYDCQAILTSELASQSHVGI